MEENISKKAKKRNTQLSLDLQRLNYIECRLDFLRDVEDEEWNRRLIIEHLSLLKQFDNPTRKKPKFMEICSSIDYEFIPEFNPNLTVHKAYTNRLKLYKEDDEDIFGVGSEKEEIMRTLDNFQPEALKNHQLSRWPIEAVPHIIEVAPNDDEAVVELPNDDEADVELPNDDEAAVEPPKPNDDEAAVAPPKPNDEAVVVPEVEHEPKVEHEPEVEHVLYGLVTVVGEETRLFKMCGTSPDCTLPYRGTPDNWMNTTTLFVPKEQYAYVRKVSDHPDFIKQEEIVIEGEGDGSIVNVLVKKHKLLEELMQTEKLDKGWFWTKPTLTDNASNEEWKANSTYQDLFRPTVAFQRVIGVIVRGMGYLLENKISYFVSTSSASFAEDDLQFQSPKLVFTFDTDTPTPTLKSIFFGLAKMMESIMGRHEIEKEMVLTDVTRFVLTLRSPVSIEKILRHPVMWPQPLKLWLILEWRDAYRFGELDMNVLNRVNAEFHTRGICDKWWDKIIKHPLTNAKMEFTNQQIRDKYGVSFGTISKKNVEDAVSFLRNVHAHVKDLNTTESFSEADLDIIFYFYFPKFSELLIEHIVLKDQSSHRFERFTCERKPL